MEARLRAGRRQGRGRAGCRAARAGLSGPSRAAGRTPTHSPPSTATPQCKTRLETHFKNVEAVMGYYNTCCVEVDGNRAMDAVFATVCSAIDQAKCGARLTAAFDRDQTLARSYGPLPGGWGCRVVWCRSVRVCVLPQTGRRGAPTRILPLPPPAPRHPHWMGHQPQQTPLPPKTPPGPRWATPWRSSAPATPATWNARCGLPFHLPRLGRVWPCPSALAEGAAGGPTPCMGPPPHSAAALSRNPQVFDE